MCTMIYRMGPSCGATSHTLELHYGMGGPMKLTLCIAVAAVTMGCGGKTFPTVCDNRYRELMKRMMQGGVSRTGYA